MIGDHTFELAHVVPGRIRLRWRGEGCPPAELLSQVESNPQVERVDYRPSSRSVVLLHTNGFDLDDLRAITGELDSGPGETPGATSAAERRGEADGKWQLVVADLEALLTLGLMVVWLRDLIVGRSIRPGTILLLILAGLSQYQFWQQRQQRRKSVEAASPKPEPAAP